jgi:hypothetical protein
MVKDRALIDPRMINRLVRFFTMRCTIEAPGTTKNSVGEVSKTFSAVPGWTAIACRLAPATGGERRTNVQTYVDATHVIALAGIFNGIGEEMQAVVDGVHYEILLVEVAAEAIITQLQVRVIR